MHWNHRVVEYKPENVNDVDGLKFGIHEAYYECGKLIGVTNDPIGICGESLKDLAKVLRWMRRALKFPVLKEEDIEKL